MDAFLFYAKIHFGIGAISVILWSLIEKYRPKAFRERLDKAMDAVQDQGMEDYLTEDFIQSFLYVASFVMGVFTIFRVFKNIGLLLSKEKVK